MTQEFVTLPRAVVEQAFAALKYEKDANNPLDWHHDKTMAALHAALEQQVEQEPVAEHELKDVRCECCGYMTHHREHMGCIRAAQPKREPLTDEQVPSPTAGMNIAQRILHVGGRNNAAGYVEFGGIQAVEALVLQVLRDLPRQHEPQVEQEPVAWIWTEWSKRKLTFDGPPAVPSVRDELTKPVWTPLYTHPQPKREPLTDAEIADLLIDIPVLGTGYFLRIARAIEAAHNIK